MALGDIADINPRLPERPGSEELVSFLPMAGLGTDGSTECGEERPFGEVSRGYTPFLDGDLLIAKITPCFQNNKIGQARIGRRVGVGSTEFHVVRPRSHVADARYLLHFLRRDQVRLEGERRMTGSGGQRRVPVGFLEGLDLPLPPLSEQQRIAAVLDRVDTLQAATTRARQLNVALIQGVVERHLGSLALSDYRSFGDCCTRLTVGVVIRPASHYVEAGVPALRTTNVKAGRIDATDLVYFSQAANDGPLAKSKLLAGDLVIARTGRPGVTAVVPDSLAGGNAIDLIVATPNPTVAHPLYLEALMNSTVGRRLVSGEQRGQIQQHFNVGSLRAALIPVPTLAVQEELVDRLLAIRRQDQLQEKRQVQLIGLADGLQARAFAGQL
ncbi:restriction endonuclease subunit S [Blastococcus sp. CCUG 61487]|uniref:restriction endonuclease subunit S n=1 Tax=Blastococcus sp. CCUG 61487 TaxID=1840703 RepID=UPI0010C0F88E|nr:restriction endonuclease subunit S [Blastococcus sp. CCUG 61487]